MKILLTKTGYVRNTAIPGIMQKIIPISAGMIYLDVNRKPNNNGFTLPKKGSRKNIKVISLEPMPANVMGNNPDIIVSAITKMPTFENKSIFNAKEKIRICHILEL